MRVLTLVPHKVAPDRHAAIEAGRHPKPNYDALADAIRSQPGGVADILDHGAVERADSLLVRAVRLVAGLNWALAVLGIQRCRDYDIVFSHAEAVSKPFALLLAFLPRRPRHVTLSNYATGRRNMVWYRWLAIDRQMDIIVMHTKVQYETAVRRLGIPERKVLFLTSCGYVDVDFFRSTPQQTVDSRLVCAVGREFRDYATLFRAIEELPNVKLKIDGNSPWSVHQDQIKHLRIPPNVDVCRLEFGTVRNLYAESAVVAIPLLPNPIGAGF